MIFIKYWKSGNANAWCRWIHSLLVNLYYVGEGRFAAKSDVHQVVHRSNERRNRDGHDEEAVGVQPPVYLNRNIDEATRNTTYSGPYSFTTKHTNTVLSSKLYRATIPFPAYLWLHMRNTQPAHSRAVCCITTNRSVV